MLEPLEPLPKMTNEELLEFTRQQEEKNSKRANQYFYTFTLLILAIIGWVAIIHK